MRILVCSRTSIPAKDRTLPAWEHLRALGHEVVVEGPDRYPDPAGNQRPDVLISMGVTVMEETFAALERYPGVPLYCYNWDVYEWVWTNPRPAEVFNAEGIVTLRNPDYKRYGELLKQARLIWVPSRCTGRRTEQWYGLTSWYVILSACPWWEREAVRDEGGGDVRDDGYALCTLRHLPDPWDTKFEEACTELGIPFLRTDHNLSRADYEDAVAHCRFLVSHFYEASTGGLTLLEGYYHGKPCLLSDSEWHGGRDYFGDRATYFRFGDYEHFKQMLRHMHTMTPVINRDRAREWIREQFSDHRMVEDMFQSIRMTKEGVPA